MKFERFKEIWDRFGFTFECSPQLQTVLVAASNGDFSHFDDIDRKFFERDTPDETYRYFKKRFNTLQTRESI